MNLGGLAGAFDLSKVKAGLGDVTAGLQGAAATMKAKVRCFTFTYFLMVNLTAQPKNL